MAFWGPSKSEKALNEAVRSSAKQATQFTPVKIDDGHPPPVTGTKFGGIPYAEAGDIWPKWREVPHDFVAQFNLRECVGAPTDAYDLLTVFVCWRALETTEGVEKACVIRTYKNPSAQRAIVMTRPRPPKESDYEVVACAAEARQVISYPSPVGSYLKVPAISALAKEHEDFSEAYVDSLRRLDYNWREERTQVGGYPSWVHDSTLEYGDLFFVAQITHEPLANFCIGDAAPIFIAAHRADPTKFEIDPCQTH